MRKALFALVACAALGTNAQAATEEDFDVDSAEDLVMLCSVAPGDPVAAEALNFCYGFVSGAYHYYAKMAKANPAHKFVCMPDPPPTRSQAVKSFVVWTTTKPGIENADAVDAMFQFLGETYPCR